MATDKQALERDAARYRWLRENHAWEMMVHFPARRPYVDAREVIDEAIDHVMQKETPQKRGNRESSPGEEKMTTADKGIL